jgi:hypothetical protein
MTRRKRRAKLLSMEVLLANDRDFRQQAVKDALQAVLERKITVFWERRPGARTESRTGYRAGVTRGAW